MIATDRDHTIIDATSIALDGKIGQEDDVSRLIEAAKQNEHTLAEVAVAFIRWCQDLKVRRIMNDATTIEVPNRFTEKVNGFLLDLLLVERQNHQSFRRNGSNGRSMLELSRIFW